MSTNRYVSAPALAAYELIDMTHQHDLIQVEHAYQPFLEREVLIRQLPSGATNPRARRDFIQEVRSQASLHHPNIAQVFEAGLNDEQPFAVYEHLHGISLQQRIEQLQGQRSGMGLEEAAQIIDGVASLVEYAHRRGARIYNLQPSNIILTGDRLAVLQTLGTPAPQDVAQLSPLALNFLPPEHLTGDVVDGRGDIYALGVLLYVLVTGTLPFVGTASNIMVQKQAAPGLPALYDAYGELPLPHTVAHVLRQATSRKLDQRYRQVSTLRQALAAALSPQPTQLRTAQRVSPIQRRRLQQRQTRHGLETVQRAVQAGAAEQAMIEEVSLTTGQADLLDQAPTNQPHATTVGPDGLPVADPSALLNGERPELQASLPFTVLVPLPEQPAAEEKAASEGTPAPDEPAPTAETPKPSGRRYLWF